MNAETIAALEDSISAWKLKIEVQSWEDIRIGPEACPLCQIFFYEENRCRGCPVYEKTGEEGCVDTPFEDAYRVYEEWFETGGNASIVEQWARVAQREVEFLESLQ